MSCACVSAPRAQRAFITQNIGGPVLDVVIGGGRVYVLHAVNGRASDMALTDPFGGDLLVECKFFNDESTAREWITADIAFHASRIGRAQ